MPSQRVSPTVGVRRSRRCRCARLCRFANASKSLTALGRRRLLFRLCLRPSRSSFALLAAIVTLRAGALQRDTDEGPADPDGFPVWRALSRSVDCPTIRADKVIDKELVRDFRNVHVHHPDLSPSSTDPAALGARGPGLQDPEGGGQRVLRATSSKADGLAIPRAALFVSGRRRCAHRRGRRSLVLRLLRVVRRFRVRSARPSALRLRRSAAVRLGSDGWSTRWSFVSTKNRTIATAKADPSEGHEDDAVRGGIPVPRGDATTPPGPAPCGRGFAVEAMPAI